MGSSFSCCGSEKVEEVPTSFGAVNNSWRIFTYKELHAATNGFSEDNKLGEGGFGSVYWGRTSDGLQIAVKKLKAMNSKAEMEFAVEVEVLGRVRHKNLLGLRGYCVGDDQRLIVYDYMPNLSLLSHLHGQFAVEVQLNWQRRMKIAIGSAEGLLFRDLVDPKLRGNFDENQVKQAINVAALCVQSEPEKRPNMMQVVSLLKGSEPDGKVTKMRIDSIKYSEELMALDQPSDDDYDGTTSYGVFSAIEVQKMNDPYKRGGNKKVG
ncbi:Serine-threonine/tyrosine-protein kinase, catalytic domain [Sesbania bispinosa]|nr:Serine-threonine/tyrosine-protein kinase, catalytic domain [Sesbania bispinosa]